MLRRLVSFSTSGGVILLSLLLACTAAVAQRHGGGQGVGTLTGAPGRPSGVDQKDSLRDFHEALAVQATTQQMAEFQVLVKNTLAAQTSLHSLQQQLEKGSDSQDKGILDQALDSARIGNKKFQEGFSPEQKAGLKEVSKRLDKSEFDLEQEQKKLDQGFEIKASVSDLTARADNLDKVLTDFYNQQLALGREMSITLANGQDLAFNLPTAKSPVSIGKRSITVPVSGGLSQTAAQGGRRSFDLSLVGDLSDLEQNITEVLRAQLEASQSCGQRFTVRQATLGPDTTVGLMVVKVHFERWSCSGQSPTELAEGDGSMEIKLKAAVENGALKVTAAPGRIDATGMVEDALRSGSLGEELREKAAQVVLAAAQAGTNFAVTLPPAVQNSATIQSASFQETGAGSLSIALGGQVEISNEQADQLATQLNQALSAQGSLTPGAVPQLATRPQ